MFLVPKVILHFITFSTDSKASVA